jgi:hypothetical protein
VQRKEHLERLIRSLVETINGTIRRSGQIRDIMKEIEHHGYEIHLSLLAGIVLRDREDSEDGLTELFADDDTFDTEQFDTFDEDEAEDGSLESPDRPLFSDEDLRFLTSLGLRPD